MLLISTHRFKDVDLGELARVTLEARRESVLRRGDVDLEEIEKELAGYADDHWAAILARLKESGELRGWISLCARFTGMLFSGSWNPIVLPSEDEDEVARALIEEAKTYTRMIGRERLEFLLDKMTDEHRELRQKYHDWYLAQGLYLVCEEDSMVAYVEPTGLPPIRFPTGFKTVPLPEVSNEDIRDSVFETFLKSNIHLFLDVAPEQRVVTFDWWFDRSRHVDDEASLVLERRGRVAGFVLIRHEDGETQLGPFGVHPDFRGKGLGKALLAESFRVLAEKGVRSINVEVDSDNSRALKLYRMFGFQKLCTQAYYCWRTEQGC